ncbi:nitrilase-related carbon-nitrogen hydrolase [Bifidobacterium tissieri]|uniref:Carbon-nitrogen hydrolase family protein n=1 Tax=Bifidobacterium tissieri TaxID=1630162 RepID=A0A5M9ZS88_9BIFI|nr:nitrilase-related carbon-nitrogen hydrolase [Bifidobacterium tissieri]KAA8829877.1 carbon-nitrogen hydrolase family protein [Bifidobacterium tissieri]KAA8830494.1 carbon-nitrogen hydrolase family protein [Bifidobacterium tissieri]
MAMTNRLTVAVAQFTVTQDPERNLKIIDGVAKDAAARSARLLVLPEGLIARDGDDDGFAAAHAQPVDGPFVQGLRRISAERGIALMGTVHVFEAPDAKAEGSAENAGDVGSGGDQAQELGQEPLRARSPLVSNVFLVIRDGEIIASYCKLHLYDAFAARESDVVRPGAELPPIVDIDGWKIGVMTCYDVRFPETARSLAVRGADAIVVSAAWVRGAAKEYHWSLMTAARAVENTCYVLACSEVSKRNIGCSRIIGPLGEAIAQAGDSEAEMIAATLDRAALADVRRTLPVLDNRRFADPVLR